MKKILFLSFLSTLCVYGMETVESLADVIRGSLENSGIINRPMNPQEVLEQLKEFESGDLKKYRDSGHNNLIHIAVQKLMAHKEEEQDVPEGSESLIQYLKDCGVSINEVNDLRESPLYLAHLAEREPYYLECLLEGLGARPVYFSLAPEIRTVTRGLRYLCGCKWFTKRKKE